MVGMSPNIEKLEKLTARLKELEHFWKTFFRCSNDLFCAMRNDHFVELNPAWERNLGWTADELRSRPILEFVHPDDQEKTKEFIAGKLPSAEAHGYFSNRFKCRDGTVINLCWNWSMPSATNVIYAVARADCPLLIDKPWANKLEPKMAGQGV